MSYVERVIKDGDIESLILIILWMKNVLGNRMHQRNHHYYYLYYGEMKTYKNH